MLHGGTGSSARWPGALDQAANLASRMTRSRGLLPAAGPLQAAICSSPTSLVGARCAGSLRGETWREHSQAMSMIPVALTPLQVGQRTVMQINALLPSVLLVIGGFVLGAFTQARFGIPAWPFALLASVVALWAVLVAPRRRWAAWGWALASDEVHVAHGVWTQVHTIVPLARVQHIDVAQGPLERAFGVARPY